MKKALMILASVALGATMASASSTNVESRNVVGFSDVPVLSYGWAIIGQNWEKPDGSAATLSEIFDPADLYPGNDINDTINCDQIYLWDPTLNEGYGDYAQFLYFDFSLDAFGVCWRDSGYTPLDQPIQKGQAFWFSRPTENGAPTFKMKGQVSTNNSVTISLPVGWSMFSSAYPIEPVMGDGIVGYPGAAVNDTITCDQIYVWDTTLNEGYGDYAQYYYFDFSLDAAGVCWRDSGYTPVTTLPNKLLLGQGGWYFNQGASAVTWTQTSPL